MSRTKRRIALAAGAAAALLLLVAACGRCAVHAPMRPGDAVEVFVLADAVHTALVLPPDARGAGGDDDGGDPQRFVAFGFGEWQWDALGDDGWYRLVPVLLWPTAGTLERRVFDARDAASLRAQLPGMTLLSLAVDRRKANALRRRLEAEFAAGAAAGAAAIAQPEPGRCFVPSPRGYWWRSTCAEVAAEWLAALDCAVDWWPVRTGLRVAGAHP